MRNLFQALLILLPWTIRRPLLERLFGYHLHPASRIGLAWVYPKHLTMDAGATIGHFTVCIHLDRIEMGEKSSLGRGNWVTGFPKADRRHFAHLPNRRPELIIGRHAAVTKNHHLDCTERIEIGAFTTIAGYHSQLLTHSIDVYQNRQDAAPIYIGDYCFVGTDCVVLGGSSLPARSVLGACSLLNESHTEPQGLFGGVPAKRIKNLDDGAYFHRSEGFVT